MSEKASLVPTDGISLLAWISGAVVITASMIALALTLYAVAAIVL